MFLQKTVILFVMSLMQFTDTILATNKCDSAICNNEAPCEIKNNQPVCVCVGDHYFTGKYCKERVDNCAENPCKNNAKCTNVLGQPICGPCPKGFGGHLCDVEDTKLFTKFYFHHNRFGYMTARQHLLFTVEDLGSRDFLVELTTDNYAISSISTDLKRSNQWKKSDNLTAIAMQLGLHHSDKLPYNSGYYYESEGTFWSTGIHKLRLKVTDPTSKKSYMEAQYMTDIIPQETCLPIISSKHCADPFKPLKIDATKFTYIDALVTKKCWHGSKFEFHWSVYDNFESDLIFTYAPTHTPRLKLEAYSQWSSYLGNYALNFMIRITIIEKIGTNQISSNARCYITIVPKPVRARIIGGPIRKIAAEDLSRMDASQSRNFAVQSQSRQSLLYTWKCKSTDDPKNTYCSKLNQKDQVFVIPRNSLKRGMSYEITLTVVSLMHIFIRDSTKQVLEVGTESNLLVIINCIKNCNMDKFIGDAPLHMSMECMNCLDSNVRAEWYINDGKLTEGTLLVIEKPGDIDTITITAKMYNILRYGIASYTLKRNTPPAGGACTIAPEIGESLETLFHINCKDFTDEDQPIKYIYTFPLDDFPMESSPASSTDIYLPPQGEISVKICDSFNLCTARTLEVEISTKSVDVPKILDPRVRNVRNMLANGEFPHAMVITLSASMYVSKPSDAKLLQMAISQIKLVSLMDIEQFVTIMDLVFVGLGMIKNDVLEIASFILDILAKGMETVINDGEVSFMPISLFQKLHNKLCSALDTLSVVAEKIPLTQLPRKFYVHVDHRRTEKYPTLDKFDDQILQRLYRYTSSTGQILRCLRLLGLISAHIMLSGEVEITTQTESTLMVTYPFSSRQIQSVSTKDNIAQIELSSSLIFDMQTVLQSTELTILRITTKKNPFWWYPDMYPISTPVLNIAGYSKRLKINKLHGFKLDDPLNLRLEVKDNTTWGKDTYLYGHIKDRRHMNIFKVVIEKHSLLKINFRNATCNFAVMLVVGKRPTAFETKASKYFITPEDSSQVLFVFNPKNVAVNAFVSVILSESPSCSWGTYIVIPELRECVSWSYVLTDPEWNTDECWPDETAEWKSGLRCFCKHMTSYAAKRYAIGGYALTSSGELLDEVPLNWYMLSTALLVGIFVVTYVFVAYFCLRRGRERLVTTPKDPDNIVRLISGGEIIIRFTTGGYRNASTTAGIYLIISTIHGPATFKVYQNPRYPQLKQHSTCTVRLPVDPYVVIRPFSIFLRPDGGGRYPSWYCRVLEINHENIDKPVYITVNSWIDETGMQINEPTELQKPKRIKIFIDHLETIFTNWFFYNPLFGPWKYGNMTCNRFERTLICFLKAAVNVVVIGVAYGWTNLKTYENERQTYMYVSNELSSTLYLSFYCFAFGSLLQLGVQYWIFKSTQESLEFAD